MHTIISNILNETASVEDVYSAIDNHSKVIINYHSKGEPKNSGARVIEPVAYGFTKAGNEVIRAYQPYGDTTSHIPDWKFFRLDRITSWKETGQEFTQPASFYNRNIGKFNPSGDATMSSCVKIASFGDNNTDNDSDTFKPQGEKDALSQMDRLKHQLDNPIYLSDIKTKDGFRDYSKEQKYDDNPKTKADAKPSKPEVYKTDTERSMVRLKQQLQNPRKIDLSQFSQEDKKNLRQKLGDTSQPIAKKDLVDKLSGPKTKADEKPSQLQQKLGDISQPIKMKDLIAKLSEPEVYKTDTERSMDRLKQQLQNPRKIDL